MGPVGTSNFEKIIKEPALRVLYRYWDELRGTAEFPTAEAIDPTEMPTLLPNLALIDTADKLRDFRFRLFGTAVCAGFGEDRTGKSFDSLSHVADIDTVIEGYWITYSERIPTYFPVRPTTDQDDNMTYSRLLLPLGSDDHVSRILSGFIFFKRRNRETGSLIW